MDTKRVKSSSAGKHRTVTIPDDSSEQQATTTTTTRRKNRTKKKQLYKDKDDDDLDYLGDLANDDNDNNNNPRRTKSPNPVSQNTKQLSFVPPSAPSPPPKAPSPPLGASLAAIFSPGYWKSWSSSSSEQQQQQQQQQQEQPEEGEEEKKKNGSPGSGSDSRNSNLEDITKYPMDHSSERRTTSSNDNSDNNRGFEQTPRVIKKKKASKFSTMNRAERMGLGSGSGHSRRQIHENEDAFYNTTPSMQDCGLISGKKKRRSGTTREGGTLDDPSISIRFGSSQPPLKMSLGKSSTLSVTSSKNGDAPIIKERALPDVPRTRTSRHDISPDNAVVPRRRVVPSSQLDHYYPGYGYGYTSPRELRESRELRKRSSSSRRARSRGERLGDFLPDDEFGTVPGGFREMPGMYSFPEDDDDDDGYNYKKSKLRPPSRSPPSSSSPEPNIRHASGKSNKTPPPSSGFPRSFWPFGHSSKSPNANTRNDGVANIDSKSNRIPGKRTIIVGSNNNNSVKKLPGSYNYSYYDTEPSSSSSSRRRRRRNNEILLRSRGSGSGGHNVSYYQVSPPPRFSDLTFSESCSWIYERIKSMLYPEEGGDKDDAAAGPFGNMFTNFDPVAMIQSYIEQFPRPNNAQEAFQLFGELVIHYGQYIVYFVAFGFFMMILGRVAEVIAVILSWVAWLSWPFVLVFGAFGRLFVSW